MHPDSAIDTQSQVLQIEHKFCAHCGKEMCQKQVTTGYNPRNGTAVEAVLWECPQARSKYAMVTTNGKVVGLHDCFLLGTTD